MEPVSLEIWCWQLLAFYVTLSKLLQRLNYFLFISWRKMTIVCNIIKWVVSAESSASPWVVINYIIVIIVTWVSAISFFLNWFFFVCVCLRYFISLRRKMKTGLSLRSLFFFFFSGLIQDPFPKHMHKHITLLLSVCLSSCLWFLCAYFCLCIWWLLRCSYFDGT